MKQGVWKHWPLVTALMLLGVLIGAVLFLSLRQNEGRLVYALDDAYIHMAIAKNVAVHGTWGILPSEFTSSSSSLLWTGLLAVLYRLFGVSESAPLLLNVLCAGAVVILVYVLAARRQLTPLATFGVLLGIVFLTPLLPLIFAGQEHVLQTGITILFGALAAGCLAGAELRPNDPRLILLLVLAPLVTLVRFEGLFLIMVVCALFLLRGRWNYALAIAALALAPVIIHGAISAGHGWSWLPNSVMIKGIQPDLSSAKGIANLLGYAGYRQLWETPHLLLLVIAALLLFVQRFQSAGGLWEEGQILLATFVATALLHVQFARTGWFFRYEAYLVAFGLLALVFSFFWHRSVEQPLGAGRRHPWARSIAVVLLIVVCGSPLIERGVRALVNTPQAMNDRYLEHITIAEFVERYYDGSAVVVNDIGAVAFYTTAQVLDIYGLGSREGALFGRLPGQEARRAIHEWTQKSGARVAILQVQWNEVAWRIPDDWVQVGLWEIPRNVVFSDTKIGFYAPSPADAPALAANLRAFSSEVPDSIQQSGTYMEK